MTLPKIMDRRGIRNFLAWILLGSLFLDPWPVYAEEPASPETCTDVQKTGAAAPDMEMAEMDMAETIRTYDYLETYVTKYITEKTPSYWGAENPGRLHMTLLRNQYNPEKTGTALLEDPAYCKALLYTVVSLSGWQDSAEAAEALPYLAELSPAESFRSEIQTLLAGISGDGDTDCTEMLLSLLSEGRERTAGGSDLAYGEYALELEALARLGSGTDGSETEAGTEATDQNTTDKKTADETRYCIWFHQVIYRSLQMLYEEDSVQYAYLDEQLANLTDSEGGELAASVPFSQYLDKHSDTGNTFPAWNLPGITEG